MIKGSFLLQPKKILAQAGVRSGMHIADIGCGRHGHFVIPAALHIGGQGKVYAVDIHPESLSYMQDHKDRHGLDHVEPVWGDFEHVDGIRIPNQSVDRVFFLNNLWVLKNPDAFIQEMKRIMKKDGKLIIVDWRPRIQHPIAPPAHLIRSSVSIMRPLVQAGARIEKEQSLGSTHWYVQAVF